MLRFFLLVLLSSSFLADAFISYMTCTDVLSFYDDCLAPIAPRERCSLYDSNVSTALNSTDSCKLEAEHLLWFQTDAELEACNYPSSPLADSFEEIWQFVSV